MNEKQVQTPQEVVEFKTRRKAAQAAIHSIHREVEEIERQAASEKRNARFLLPWLIGLLALVLLLVYSPQIYRVISHLLNVS